MPGVRRAFQPAPANFRTVRSLENAADRIAIRFAPGSCSPSNSCGLAEARSNNLLPVV
jgi:hypothetical protein